MNQKIFLTKAAFNSLLANLLEIEEGVNEIINVFFFREPLKETEDWKQILNDYLKQLNEVINDITIAETATNDFPYVIIGSEVILADTGTGGTYSYKLISPLKNKIDFHEISFLSPMGKVLLLKKVNDNFVVEAPGGNYEYKVLSIRITTGSKNF